MQDVREGREVIKGKENNREARGKPGGAVSQKPKEEEISRRKEWSSVKCCRMLKQDEKAS